MVTYKKLKKRQTICNYAKFNALSTFKCICLVLITIWWVASRVQSSQPSAPTSNNEWQINIQIKTSFLNRKNGNQKFPESAHRWLVIFLVWHKVLPVKIEIDIQWNCEAEIGPKNVKVCLSSFFISCINPPFTILFFNQKFLFLLRRGSVI